MTEDVLVATLFAAFAITFAAFQLARMARSWWQDRQDRAAFAELTEHDAAMAQVTAQLRSGMDCRMVTLQRPFDPSQIPDDAKSVRWESCHLFSPYGKRPERTVFGLHVSEPPLAMTCVECDLRQPVLHHGARRCAYCGTVIMVHGTRVYFWRDKAVEVEEWRA